MRRSKRRLAFAARKRLAAVRQLHVLLKIRLRIAFVVALLAVKMLVRVQRSQMLLKNLHALDTRVAKRTLESLFAVNVSLVHS